MSAPNVLLVTRDHASDDVREMRAEREQLVARVVELAQKIALTETLELIARTAGVLSPQRELDIPRKAAT